jgi:hypothetical protein
VIDFRVMIAYQTKASKIAGTSYKEVYANSMKVFNRIRSRTKRKPYIRSAYFNKQKVFFDLFWRHLMQKRIGDRMRRLKYFAAALDLIRNSRNHPTTKENPNNKSELVHRFVGLTKEKEEFYVQIKEVKRTGTKQLISVFAK